MGNRAIVLLISAVLVTGVSLFYLLMESYQETEDLGWGEEAYKNQYLASEQFLQRLGINAETQFSLLEAEPLAQVTTLFIADSHDVLSGQQGDRLMEWLKQGGHLIISGHYYDEGETNFLNRFDIEFVETDCNCYKNYYYPDDTEQEASQEDNSETSTATTALDDPSQEENQAEEDKDEDIQESIDPTLLTVLTFEDMDTEISVNFNPATELYHPYLDYEEDEYTGYTPFYWEGSDWGTHFLQFQVGDGLLTVISDPYIFDNDEINDYDHSYLLSVLAGQGSTLTFVIGKNVPSLITLAWRHGPELFAAFGVWLLFWIFYRSKRFLPPEQRSVTSRRSLAEHIEAVAHFYW